MADGCLLTTTDVGSLFRREVSAIGGTVKDVFDDGSLLFSRCVLPDSAEIQRGDRVHAGVALRASILGVDVHPYTFREVCTNGAIMAEAIATHRVAFEDCFSPDHAADLVVEAVAACARPAVFAAIAGRLRSAREQKADLALNLLPMLGRLPRERSSRVLSEILKRFLSDEESSAYGLFNAVTSVARDTSEPHARWGLEELGGAVALCVTPRTPARDGKVAHVFAPRRGATGGRTQRVLVF